MNQRHYQNTSCEFRYELDGRKCNSTQKWNNNKHSFEYKKSLKHRACEEYFAWNPNTCVCKWDKNCDIIQYETADLVTFTEEILNGKLHFLCSVKWLWMHGESCWWSSSYMRWMESTSENAVINPSNRIIYWLIAVIQLAIPSLILLLVIIAKYYMKRGLTIPCLLSY